MAEFFQWDASRFSLGVPEMDAEHRELIGLMNRLHELHGASAPPRELAAALEALVRYTGKHFADEEAYMQRIGYAGLRTHQGVHRHLLERLAQFGETFRRERRLGDDFFTFLRMWLSSHICGVDMKYTVREGAAAPAPAKRGATA